MFPTVSGNGLVQAALCLHDMAAHAEMPAAAVVIVSLLPWRLALLRVDN
jgi:hypothetical protein